MARRAGRVDEPADRTIERRLPAGAVEAGAGLGAGLLVLAVSLVQWGATPDGLFRGLTLGTWTGIVVALILWRRRRRAEREASDQKDRRLALARDLHDTVAGHVAVIGVQAAAARRVLDRDPASAAVALERIERSARAANTDLRRMLDALRAGEAPEPLEAIGLAGVAGMVDDLRAAGADVDVIVTPEALALADPALDRAAARLVGEALTNAIRHAGPVRIDGAVKVEDGQLRIVVENAAPIADGVGPGVEAAAGKGHGIVGMRERAAAFGGSVEAGPTPAGGFRVDARLPLGGATMDAGRTR